jgi:hypothetical protein
MMALHRLGEGSFCVEDGKASAGWSAGGLGKSDWIFDMYFIINELEDMRPGF